LQPYVRTDLKRIADPLDALFSLVLEPLADDVRRALVKVPRREKDVSELERALRPGPEEPDRKELAECRTRKREERERERDGGEPDELDAVSRERKGVRMSDGQTDCAARRRSSSNGRRRTD
jgi:hypothetical protein